MSTYSECIPLPLPCWEVVVFESFRLIWDVLIEIDPMKNARILPFIYHHDGERVCIELCCQ